MDINIKISYDDEIWKDIDGHQNLYQISNKGRIRKKSYVQKYKGVVYTCNGSVYTPIKRNCGERMLTPQMKCGKPSIVFEDLSWMWIEDLMNIYFKNN